MLGYHGYFKEAVLLLALGLGYIVYYLAHREERGLKIVGYIIGVSIITLSSILILMSLISTASFRGYPQRMHNKYLGRQRQRMMMPRRGAMMQNSGSDSVQTPPQ
ncbi:MAG: hypothetical protein NC828_00665 [Candidatus Omnitrophica bacterium]|nr:hypothetical protein [Candidatus Omnitrophota bacterium]